MRRNHAHSLCLSERTCRSHVLLRLAPLKEEWTSRQSELSLFSLYKLTHRYQVWLASHMGDRKLSKAQLLGTSIPKSVGAIMGQESVSMALRLSGQLLLGVARIYSRKAKYLVDDCNDALLKIKMTFRPGATAAVDMPADQANVAKGAITRQEQANDFDLLYQDIDIDYWNPEVYQRTATPGRAVAIADDADITRPDEDFDDELPRVEFGDDLFGLPVIGDFDLEMGDTLDLGAVVGHKRPRDDDDISVEIGRDAPGSSARKSARLSLASHGGADDDLTFDQTFDDFGGGRGYEQEVDYGPVGKDPFADHSLGGDFDLSGVLDGEGIDIGDEPRAPTVEPVEGKGAQSTFSTLCYLSETAKKRRSSTCWDARAYGRRHRSHAANG